MKLNPARQLATRIADTMQPYADGVTIAGAIRRRVAEIRVGTSNALKGQVRVASARVGILCHSGHFDNILRDTLYSAIFIS